MFCFPSLNSRREKQRLVYAQSLIPLYALWSRHGTSTFSGTREEHNNRSMQHPEMTRRWSWCWPGHTIQPWLSCVKGLLADTGNQRHYPHHWLRLHKPGRMMMILMGSRAAEQQWKWTGCNRCRRAERRRVASAHSSTSIAVLIYFISNYFHSSVLLFISPARDSISRINA